MPLETPDSITIYKTDISPDGNILLGTNLGIYYSIDDGISWNKMGDLVAGVTNIEYYSDFEIIAGATELYNSVDQGQSWNLVYPNTMMQVLFCTREDYLLLGKWGGILKSEDRGYNWDTVHLTGNATTFESFIEFDGIYYSGGIDFIGGENSGFHKSIDYGDSWELFSLQEHGISKLIIDTEGCILAGVNTAPSTQDIGLYKSSNQGVLWENVFEGQQVVAVSVDSLGGYYVGLESGLGSTWGVNYSADQGITWQEINSGLEQSDVVYDIDANAQYVYCILLNYKNERKLYRSKNPIVSIPECELEDVDMIKIYPNPIGYSHDINIVNNSTEKFYLDIISENGIVIFKKLEISDTSIWNCALDFGKMKPGIYYLHFYNSATRITKKIVKTI